MGTMHWWYDQIIWPKAWIRKLMIWYSEAPLNVYITLNTSRQCLYYMDAWGSRSRRRGISSSFMPPFLHLHHPHTWPTSSASVPSPTPVPPVGSKRITHTGAAQGCSTPPSVPSRRNTRSLFKPIRAAFGEINFLRSAAMIYVWSPTYICVFHLIPRDD